MAKPKKTTIDRINERGWSTGWFVDMLEIRAKHAGKTMAQQFLEDIKDKAAFNIHATAIKIKHGLVTYRFKDGSEAQFLLPNFLRTDSQALGVYA